MSADTTAGPSVREHADDYREHARTYKGFVRAVVIFTANCIAILILMAVFLL